MTAVDWNGPGDAPLMVRLEVEQRVATVTLARPQKNNAMTPEMQRQLRDALLATENDGAVDAVVLTGEGRAFCPGADLANLRDEGSDGSQRAHLDTAFEAVQLARRLSKAVICAINGGCAGVGLALACMADVRIAADTAKFATAFSRRGLVAEYGLAHLLPRMVGQGRALDLLLSGRTFTAADAYDYGIVQEVVAADELQHRARAYAIELVRDCSPTSLAVIKRQVHLAEGGSFEQDSARAKMLMPASRSRADVSEGVNAFLQKRAPQFSSIDQSMVSLLDTPELQKEPT